jgi:hypothetical protein
MHLRDLFRPDFVRYDGVRPINIWGLRLFYLLMAAFVASTAWRVLLTHEGPWEPMRALAFCVWATYPTLAVLGLLHPLRMLPIMLFTIGYKTLWFVFVAYPLWASGTLAGSPVEAITNSFLGLPVLVLVVPWGYVWRTYVRLPRRGAAAAENPAYP